MKKIALTTKRKTTQSFSQVKEKNNLGSFSQSLMYQIHTMTFLSERMFEKKLSKNSPLSFSQFVILMGINCQEFGSTNQTTLADFLHMTEATISRHIKILCQEGLLCREASIANKKTKLLTLTDLGAKAFDKTHSIIKKEIDSIFSSLKEIEKNNLAHYFERLVATLLKKNH